MRSFATPTGLVRLPEELLVDTRIAVLALRCAGYVTTTLTSFISNALRAHLTRLHAGELGPDQLGPQASTLFEAS